MKNPFFKNFPDGQFIDHQGHFIPIELTPAAEIKDFSKLFFPYPRSGIKITGEDRASFLNGLGPTDLRQFKAGDGTRCLFTNAHGNVIFDTHLAGFEDHLILFPEPGEEVKMLAHLEFNAILEKVAFEDLGEAFELAYIFGNEAGEQPGLSLENGDGYSVRFAPSELFSQLVKQGFSAVGFSLFEEVRPLYGISRSGVDFGAHQLPQEAGLEAFMEFQKGCYLGQEPISRVAFRGRLRNRLEKILSGEPLNSGDKIFVGDNEVGHVTSPSNLKTSQGFYSLAYLATKLAEEPEIELFCGNTQVQVPRYHTEKPA